MGPWKKYSCGIWNRPGMTLEESEVAALELVCKRAQITDSGLSILDMGCGWGSATLFIASRYPTNRVVGVSNSASQREYILKQAAQRGLTNVDVITCDINTFDAGAGRFDR
jgi:cyclopropane-fatty-acyl-phospholipid synthase